MAISTPTVVSTTTAITDTQGQTADCFSTLFSTVSMIVVVCGSGLTVSIILVLNCPTGDLPLNFSAL
jgi:hypothetical protein